MSSPGFPGGGSSSDFYGGAASFSGRSITLPSSNMNNNNNNIINNNNNNYLSNIATTTTHNNLHHPFYRTQQHQLPSIFIDPSTQIAQRQTSSLIGKRTLAEFQTQNINTNNNLNLHNFNNNLNSNLNHHNNINNNTVLSNLLLRSVKPRNFQHGSPMSPLSPIDFSNSSPEFINPSSFSSPRLGLPLRSNPIVQNPLPMNNSILQNTNFIYQNSNFSQIQNRVIPTSYDPPKKMMDHRFLELEKQLLEDNDEEGEQDAVSGITNSEWSETIQNLISFEKNPTQKPESYSPTSSTTSLNSCSSSVLSPASGCSKQLLMEAATAISEGKMEYASEILNRMAQNLNPIVNSDRRLMDCMVSALKSRVNHVENPPPVVELFSKEHAESTQLLFDHSLCFKVSFMAANIAILEAVFEETTDKANNKNNVMKLCVLDFDIGHGKQYMSLLNELHARLNGSPATLKITAMAENDDEERLKTVGENLGRQAERLRIWFEFKVVTQKLAELTRESLGCDSEDILAVNFAFKLFRMPDESVSTENPRDALLRSVKSLAPRVVIILEQEINTNTAPFVARVAESCSYYGALFDSIESTMGKDNPERVKIEEGLSQKLCNAVACEGRDRVERCEVFGKWRARMSMAGFRLNPVSQKVAESIKARLAPGSRVTVSEENGGVCFGWMGRTLTVASAWR
ncbi:Scarecrow-like 8 [Trifolium repens]|nr:Scarecrow-like 8 [Trifolium repens]